MLRVGLGLTEYYVVSIPRISLSHQSPEIHKYHFPDKPKVDSLGNLLKLFFEGFFAG